MIDEKVSDRELAENLKRRSLSDHELPLRDARGAVVKEITRSNPVTSRSYSAYTLFFSRDSAYCKRQDPISGITDIIKGGTRSFPGTVRGQAGPLPGHMDPRRRKRERKEAFGLGVPAVRLHLARICHAPMVDVAGGGHTGLPARVQGTPRQVFTMTYASLSTS